MNVAKQLDTFHKTKLGLLLFALIELAITYGFFSLAIDRGNLWWYLLTLVFFVGFLQNLLRLLGSVLKRPNGKVQRGR